MTIKALLESSVSGPSRPVIENVKPEISGGRYAVKRIVNEPVEIDATVFIDGHEILSCEVLYKHHRDKSWNSVRLVPHPKKKDLWNACFTPTQLGDYVYTVRAWVDYFSSWRSDTEKKHAADQDVTVDFLLGIRILEKAAKAAKGKDRATILGAIKVLNDPKKAAAQKMKAITQKALCEAMERHPDQSLAATYERELHLTVDRERARFSSWYEFFPRSTSGDTERHGTFKDAEKMIPYVASMGFDIIYLPPIHPIGDAHRKGKNNSLIATLTDPGSPWGIGSPDGGHKSVHPQLGTLADFRRFVAKAKQAGIEVALDLAYQCSPDHPYVKTHPNWFKRRPDGTIQYAENPPKKYQDIYPFNFETNKWPELWMELKSIVNFWIKQGVHVFRVDNPHTKACGYWKWMIGEIKDQHPEVLFLAEAFTRPAMMYHLAKIGFTQSYTYFTWRNTKAEFITYLDELTKTELADFYGPNFWPNTPDILPAHLQTGGRPAFQARLVLAATLSSNYGIYGPAYEFGENQPLHEGSEEYLNSEKYEIRKWDLNTPGTLRNFISTVNHARKKNKALQTNKNLNFHEIDNEQLLAYTKHTSDMSNIVLSIVNLDFKNAQSGKLKLPLELFGIGPKDSFRLVNLIDGSKRQVKGSSIDLKLDPKNNPALLFKVELGKAKSRR